MSYISEKVSYLDGLADGMNIAEDKNGKLLKGIIDALGAIAEELEEQSDMLDDLSDCVDDIYEELDDLEEDDDDDEGFDDDDFVEVECPSCGETVYFDVDMVDSEEGLICPNCNAPIELDISCDCGCGCGCEDEKDDE